MDDAFGANHAPDCAHASHRPSVTDRRLVCAPVRLQHSVHGNNRLNATGVSCKYDALGHRVSVERVEAIYEA